MTDGDFDVLILGAGSGGYACALRAAQLGLTVGPGREGQPRRHLPPCRLHPDQGPAARGGGGRLGARGRRSSASTPPSRASTWPGVNAYKDSVVARLFKGLTGLIKSRGITVIEGEGRVTGPRTVTVDGCDVHRQEPRPGLRLLHQVPARPRGRRRARHQLRARAQARPGAGVGDRARRRRHRLRVRQRLEVLRRRRSPSSRPSPDSSPPRTRRRRRRSSARSASARSTSSPARRSRA